MATRAYEVEELELQNGDVIILKPLNLKLLRQFMGILAKLGAEPTEEEKANENFDPEERNMDLMVEAAAVVIRPQNPKLANDSDALLEALDIPTMWRMFEVVAGVQMDPNQISRVVEVGPTLTS